MNTARLFHTGIFFAGLLCFVPLLAPAQEAESDAAIDRLVKQLDADEFAERQAATQKLEELGASALLALEAATQGKSHEAASRAMAILKTHFQSGQPALKQAAKESLQRIAKGENAAAARHAEEVLTPPPEPNANARPALPGLRPGMAPLRLAIAGAAKRVSVKTVNGVKDVEVEEKDRKIKIHDDPAKGIEMEVTEKKDGKEETKKYEAKNADELKTKHPEAHKLFEEFAKAGAAAVRVEVVGGARPPIVPALPAPVEAAPAKVVPAEPMPARIGDAPVLPPIKLRTADTEKQLADSLQAALKEVEAALEQLGKATDKPDELPRVKERLEAAQKRLNELKAKLAE